MSAPAQKLWPSPGEDDGARVADVGEGLGELGDQLGVEGVPALGPREGDPQDVVRRGRSVGRPRVRA